MAWVGSNLKCRLIPNPLQWKGIHQAAQSPIEPDLKYFHWPGFHNFSGHLVPEPHQPHSQEFLPTTQSKPTLFQPEAILWTRHSRWVLQSKWVLLVTLLRIKPRMQCAFWAASAHCLQQHSQVPGENKVTRAKSISSHGRVGWPFCNSLTFRLKNRNTNKSFLKFERDW